MEIVDNLVLFLILVEWLWMSLHLNWCWLWACRKLPLLCLGMFLISLISPGFLSWRGVLFFGQRSFLHLMTRSFGFCLSLCSCESLHLSTYICWTIPASLERCQLYYGRSSFWCVLRFFLQIFNWEFLHLSL